MGIYLMRECPTRSLHSQGRAERKKLYEGAACKLEASCKPIKPATRKGPGYAEARAKGTPLTAQDRAEEFCLLIYLLVCCFSI